MHIKMAVAQAQQKISPILCFWKKMKGGSIRENIEYDINSIFCNSRQPTTQNQRNSRC